MAGHGVRRSILLLVSSMSAGGRSVRLGPRIVRILRSGGWEVAVRLTTPGDDPAALAGLETDAAEAFKLFHRTGYTTYQIANVQLHYYFTIAFASIGYLGCNGEFASFTKGGTAKLYITNIKGGVAQSVTKRIERCDR